MNDDLRVDYAASKAKRDPLPECPECQRQMWYFGEKKKKCGRTDELWICEYCRKGWGLDK